MSNIKITRQVSRRKHFIDSNIQFKHVIGDISFPNKNTIFINDVQIYPYRLNKNSIRFPYFFAPILACQGQSQCPSPTRLSRTTARARVWWSILTALFLLYKIGVSLGAHLKFHTSTLYTLLMCDISIMWNFLIFQFTTTLTLIKSSLFSIIKCSNSFCFRTDETKHHHPCSLISSNLKCIVLPNIMIL